MFHPFHPVMVHAYTALEALRVAIQLFEAMAEADTTGIADEYDERNQAGLSAAALGLVVSHLQEHVTAGRLSVPDAAFKMIRQHRNGDGRNFPGSEATLIALALTMRELDVALDDDALDGDDPVYRILLGAFVIVRNEYSFLESITTCVDEAAALEAVSRGCPVPAYNHRAKIARLAGVA